MSDLTPAILLKVWECGAPASPTLRGLLLMGLAWPEATRDELLQAPIGHRDARLLSVRETLFGHQVACLMDCPACSHAIQLDFQIEQVRATHALSDKVCEVEVEGRQLRFRLPCSADLLALEGCTDAVLAERALLRRCRLDAGDGATPASELDDALAETAASTMALADPQAEVLLDVDCPACRTRSSHLFDIVDHLWRELDHWARGLLGQVHAIAARYGWSEDSILALSRTRRQAYLDLIGFAP